MQIIGPLGKFCMVAAWWHVKFLLKSMKIVFSAKVLVSLSLKKKQTIFIIQLIVYIRTGYQKSVSAQLNKESLLA